MNTLNNTDLTAILGGWDTLNNQEQWAYDLLMRQLQQQAEEAEREAWEEYLSTQTA
ncbi:MAG: hypothetical protein HYV95_16015 [Opitutae bacterium]|nr:hypothetical protein [Opitutae bacterium]